LGVTNKYKTTVDSFENEVSKVVYCPEEFNYSLDSVSFYSEKFVKSFHSTQLKDFVKNIDKKLKDHIQSINKNTLESTNKKDLKPSFHVGYDMSEQQIVLYVSVTNKDDEKFRKCLRELFSEYKHHYREKLFTYDKDPLEENLFRKLDSYIYSLASNSNYYELEKLVKLIKEVFDSRIKISDRTIRELSISNHRLFTVYKGIKNDRAYSSALFKYWYSYFKASTTNESANFISFAVHDLYNAIKNGIFCDEDIDELDRKITFLYKIEKVTPITIYRYVDALISISIKFESIDKKDYSFKMLSFIRYLIDDFKSEKSYIREQYTEHEYNEIIQICREGLILSIFYYFTTIAKSDKRFLNLIEKKQVLSISKDLYMNEERRWSTFSWNRDRHNRHGMGQISSFSMSNTLKKGILSYLVHINYSTAPLRDFYIPFQMLHFFHEIKAELQNQENVRLAKFEVIKHCLARCV
jgi:hypothetical protein